MEQEFYSDLPLNPVVNSKGDISILKNKECIKQSLSMLLNTHRGSRIFMPDYGCRIRGFLFEPFEESTAKRIGKEIEETINNYEPRIDIINIDVSMVLVSSSYDVTLVYKITNTETVDAFKVSLEKL